ncbi:MAG: hypothetical protein ACI9KE_000601 [Polyangiales bacterium]|jgi:hypothetical protein
MRAHKRPDVVEGVEKYGVGVVIPRALQGLGQDGVRRAAMSDMWRPKQDGQKPRLQEKPTTISWPYP